MAVLGDQATESENTFLKNSQRQILFQIVRQNSVSDLIQKDETKVIKDKYSDKCFREHNRVQAVIKKSDCGGTSFCTQAPYQLCSATDL